MTLVISTRGTVEAALTAPQAALLLTEIPQFAQQCQRRPYSEAKNNIISNPRIRRGIGLKAYRREALLGAGGPPSARSAAAAVKGTPFRGPGVMEVQRTRSEFVSSSDSLHVAFPLLLQFIACLGPLADGTISA